MPKTFMALVMVALLMLVIPADVAVDLAQSQTITLEGTACIGVLALESTAMPWSQDELPIGGHHQIQVNTDLQETADSGVATTRPWTAEDAAGGVCACADRLSERESADTSSEKARPWMARCAAGGDWPAG